MQLEEGSIARHAGERKVRTAEDDEISIADSTVAESEVTLETVSDNDEESEDESEQKTDGNDESVKSDTEQNDENVENDKSQNMDDETETGVKTEKSENDVKGEICDNESSDRTSENKESKREIIVQKQCKSVKLPTNVLEFPDTEISLHHVKGDK